MKRILLLCVSVLSLSACAGTAWEIPQSSKLRTTAAAAPAPKATDVAANMAAMPKAQIQTEPDVQTYDTSGPVTNPLTVNRVHSVLDNTTSGGYTVFDDSVTVYPLPGEEAPAFMPTYAVPPLESQYKPVQPMMGRPIGLASAGILPPVKNVEVPDADPYAKPPVPGAVRQPLTLTTPGPVTMQPPSQVRAPMASPFDANGVPVAVAPASAVVVPPAPVIVPPVPVERAPDAFARIAPPKPISVPMDEGRKSSPSLTGY